MRIKPDLFEFLSDLKENNNREWFKKNKDRYESDLKDISLNCEQNGLKFVFMKTKNNWTAAVFQKQ